MKPQYLILLLCLAHAPALFGRTALPTAGDGCDTVYTRDGRMLLVRTKAMDDQKLVYKLCDQQQVRQEYQLPLSDILSVHWHLPPQQRRVYRAWVHVYGHTFPLSGFLLMTTDSSILLSQSPDPRFPRAVTTIPVSQIKKIKLSPRGKLGRSMAAGAAIGTVAGLVLGYASGDDDKDSFFALTKEDKARLGAGFLGITGLLIGFFIGLSKKIILLDRNADKYRLLRPLLTRYSLTGK